MYVHVQHRLKPVSKGMSWYENHSAKEGTMSRLYCTTESILPFEFSTSNVYITVNQALCYVKHFSHSKFWGVERAGFLSP